MRGVFGAVSEPFRSRWSGFVVVERGYEQPRRARFVLRGIGRRAGVQVRFKALAGDEKRVSGPTQGLRRRSPDVFAHQTDARRPRRRDARGVREPSRPEGLRDVRRRRRPARVHALRPFRSRDGDVRSRGAVRGDVVADEAGADRVRRRRREGVPLRPHGDGRGGRAAHGAVQGVRRGHGRPGHRV